MRFEEIIIKWTEWSIEHIARHSVEPHEVEECIFENEPVVLKTLKKGRGRDRYVILCRCPHGRYLMIVLSKPDEYGYVKVITARDMTKRERRYYHGIRR